LPTTTAVDAARAVVGWYGDPTVSWSVLLHATLHTPADPAAVEHRLAATVARYPHLGDPPAVSIAAGSAWRALLARFADEPYADGRPLVRVAAAADEPRLAIAAHHGATDGLGLLALLADALGVTVSSSVRGVGERRSASSFALTAARRLAEAVFRPPARISADGGNPAATGDVLLAAELPNGAGSNGAGSNDVGSNCAVPDRALAGEPAAGGPAVRFGTGALVAATARSVEAWNDRHGSRRRRGGRQVAGIGASRRGGDRLSPELDSAFLRVALPVRPGDAAVRRLVAARPPEPAYPHTRSAAPQAVTRALARRLGSTFLVSNLGRVHTGGAVRSLAFHPTASGRSGVAIGAATAGTMTTITIRARRSDFDERAAGELLAAVVDELRRRH